MTYSLIDSSRTKGSPILLLLFQYGPNIDQFEAYTNNEESVLYDGKTYEPVPLDTDSFKIRTVQKRESFSVQLPNSTRISSLFRFYPPPYPVSLVIRQMHRKDVDEEAAVVWTGRVMSAAPGPNLRTAFTCESTHVSLRRTGATRKWQRSCGLALYGPECRANKIAATYAATVTNISGLDVTLNTGWVSSALYEKFANGTLSWDTDDGKEYRSIMDVSGSGILSLSGRTTGLVIGAAVEAILGCDRLGLDGDCNLLHNNYANYGGQEWIPDENPTGKDNF